MPRVADIYSRPAGIDAVTNATIDSSDYNLNVADVENDLNIARPIVAGGTGATSATGARDNLDAAVAGAQVTNYDTHVFESGTFYSAIGATAAPVPGVGFMGFASLYPPDGQTKIIKAYNGNDSVSPGRPWVRQKLGAAPWGPWKLEDAVQKAGDTMTGNLTIKPATGHAALTLDKPVGTTFVNAIIGSYNGEARWQIRPGSAGDLDNGTNTGSDFLLIRYNDSGAEIGTPLSINRATGAAAFEGYINANGHTGNANARVVINHLAGGNPGLIFQNAGTIRWDFQVGDAGEDFVLSRNSVTRAITVNRAAGNVAIHATTAAGSSTTGALTVAGGVGIAGNLAVGGAVGFGLAAPGSNPGAGNTLQGTATDFVGSLFVSRTGTVSSIFNVNQDGGNILIHRSGLGVGSISVTTTATGFNTSSDARLKEDLKAFDAGNIIDNTMVYDFAWKATGKRAYGVIAQQAVEVYDAPVFHDAESDRWFVDYSKYVPVILQELKALRARVAELEAKVA